MGVDAGRVDGIWEGGGYGLEEGRVEAWWVDNGSGGRRKGVAELSQW